MESSDPDADLMEFVDDEPETPGIASPQGAAFWRILIIDDDLDVHQATLFSLESLQLFGRRLQFLHAYSAQQARQLLLTESDLALILLDVVMETPEAGLELVDYIRNTAHLKNARIVLRTGQPGYAPEQETILRYDINDYKTKSELTHHKLATSVTAAIRSYQQLCVMDANRQGLELIVQASGCLLETQGLHMFAGGVITQLAAILGTSPDGLVCAQGDWSNQQCTVVAAAGQFAYLIDQPLQTVPNDHVRQSLFTALQSGQSHHGTYETVLYFGEKEGLSMAAYVGSAVRPREIDSSLLSVFALNMSVCLRNLVLMHRLQTDAYVDPLLRLPNRTRFIETISQRLSGTTQSDTVALVDVDDFSAVNDLMGHAYGDELLRAFAGQLSHSLGSDVYLARVASNTFGLLGPRDVLTPQRLAATAHHAVMVFEQPHVVSVTSAIAVLDDSSYSGADWLKNASIALKHAKRHQRGGYECYSADMASQSRSRAQLLANLHQAFGDDRLFIAYQPQVDLHTGALIGMEALLRWRTEDGKMIAPDQFIPIAEQSGLIVSLGDWVLQTACRDMRLIRDQGLASCHMAVNVSVVQLRSPGFVPRVLEVLEQSGLRPQELELEITESIAMLGADAAASMLRQLRAAGIAVSIDDFGTGYSSLSYLEKMPLDRIKIDRAFVIQLGQEGSPRIAEMITQLGHKLDLRVLAEGIEDAAAWAALRDMGCHEGQGYFISRPLDFAALCSWLARRPQNVSEYGLV